MLPLQICQPGLCDGAYDKASNQFGGLLGVLLISTVIPSEMKTMDLDVNPKALMPNGGHPLKAVDNTLDI